MECDTAAFCSLFRLSFHFEKRPVQKITGLIPIRKLCTGEESHFQIQKIGREIAKPSLIDENTTNG